MSKRNIYMKTKSGEVFETRNSGWHKDCEELPRAEGERVYKEQCLASLKKIIKPGSTIYCQLMSVSSSGMQRRIRLHVIHKGQLSNIESMASVVTGRKLSDKGGIVCNGCGMDMGFDLVYSLGCALWPKGTSKPHGTRNGEPDNFGGYAIKHSWI